MGYKFTFCEGCETRRSCDDCLHLSELEKAEREGRLKIIPRSPGGTCGACGHFERIPGKKRGHCKIRPYVKDRYGHEIKGVMFTVAQSRMACVNSVPMNEEVR